MGVQTNIGDVFVIPLDESTCVAGQIINSWKEELYIAIFDRHLSRNEVDLKTAIAAEPVLLTLSLDGKLWNGHWPVIGNCTENLSHIPEPNYKVRQDGKIYLESRDRTYTRRASDEEAGALQFRTVSSPIIVEKAIKAHFGIGEWKPAYDELLAKHAIASSELT